MKKILKINPKWVRLVLGDKMNNLGRNIKEGRKLKKLTQNELAERVGVSKHAIAKYEQGQREPNLNILTNIINELELDFWEVSPSMDLEIEAMEPYEEGIKFADEVCYRVNRRKLAKEWIKESNKEEILDEFIKNCEELDVLNKLKEVESRAYAKKYSKPKDKDDNSFKEYMYFYEFRNKIYKEMRDAVLFTIELKLKEAEKAIEEYCK